MTKGFTVSIYKFPLGDCTNGGLSGGTTKNITIVGDAAPAMYEPDKDAPGFKVVTKHYSFGSHTHLEPLDPPPDGHIGWMMGGNFAHTSDSRWKDIAGHAYPLPIHDRSESKKQYDSYD